MAQNVCITPHPEEGRPCTTRYAHSLESCPQCGGTDWVTEEEFERVLAELAEKPKPRSRKVADTPQA